MCPDVSVKNGSLGYWNQKFEKNTAGTVVIVKCQTDYQPVQGHSVAICNLQGHWDPNPPDCGGQYHYISTSYKLPHYCTLCLPSSVPCSPLSLHGNVSTNTSSNAPRTSVQFFCNNGGKLSGNAVISCLQNGSWSGPVPSCGGGSTGNSFVPCYNCRCCLNPILFNFLSNRLPLHLTSFSVACYPFSSFLKSITLTFLTQSLSYQELAYHSTGEIEQLLPHILFHRKHWCCGRCGHWRHSTSAGCHSDNCHCHMEAYVSYGNLLYNSLSLGMLSLQPLCTCTSH